MKSSRAFRTCIAGALLLGVPLLGACASTPGLKQAERSDLVALRKTLERQELSPSETREIAAAVLSAEIRNSEDRKDRSFVRSLRPCSGQLKPALRSRAKGHDGVGAEAALLLYDAGSWDNPTGQFRDDEDGAWRALAARASQNQDDLRRDFFVDPDERVRRAALSAALEAQDEEDLDELLEVSRLDPDPLSRNRAYQVLGRLGGTRVAQALRDRYEPGNEEIRLAIVDAWAQKKTFRAGGEKALTRLISAENGFPALHAASVLVKQSSSSDLRNRAATRLVRFAEEGTVQERRLALRFMPLSRSETIPQLLKQRKSDDSEVAVIAWARLLGHEKYHADAQIALSEIARSDSPLAFQARSALAASADERILPLLMIQARSEDPSTRRVAGYGLVRLAAWSSVAPLLADANDSVRHAVACRALATPPRPRKDKP